MNFSSTRVAGITATVLLFSTVMLLSGCAAALIGGGAVAGYSVAKGMDGDPPKK